MNRLSATVTLSFASALLLLALAACQAPAPPGATLIPASGSTGDPPIIPHQVADADNGEECLACHRQGEGGAPKTPHPWLVDCRQCHIPQQGEPGVFKPAY